LLPFNYFCFFFLLRFIFKNPAISAHFARSRQSPVHHTWIRQILARFTARVLLRPGSHEAPQALRFHLAPFRNRARIVMAKLTFSNYFAPAKCERDGLLWLFHAIFKPLQRIATEERYTERKHAANYVTPIYSVY
jgi:hypothetical protein